MYTDNFAVSAIPPSHLRRIRAAEHDDFGNPVEVFVAQEAGETPLRCCLREAGVGESVALIAHQPSDRGGPYAEVGPVFIHAEPCDGYQSANTYPEGFRRRRQLFRAYDVDGRQVHNQIVESTDDVSSVIAELFERPDVAFIHSRNVLAGCYMFAIHRVHDGLR
ncbi:MAG TPA: DUF1203 domain-containing protein [Kineosporiaceae bacterium]|nr:DUF1203 domain-containing protein [Kineosporiaceae bacterium]